MFFDQTTVTQLQAERARQLRRRTELRLPTLAVRTDGDRRAPSASTPLRRVAWFRFRTP